MVRLLPDSQRVARARRSAVMYEFARYNVTVRGNPPQKEKAPRVRFGGQTKTRTSCEKTIVFSRASVQSFLQEVL